MRRYLRFSLRTFIVAVTLICVWLGMTVHRARQQRDAAAAMTREGVHVFYDYDFDEHVELPELPEAAAGSCLFFGSDRPSPLTWVQAKLGCDLNCNVAVLKFPAVATDKVDLTRLRFFPRLVELNLSVTCVSDSDLAGLAANAELRKLDLWGTSITDEGLQHLWRLKQLKHIVLYDTQVTRTGVDRLRRQLPDCEIEWWDDSNRRE